MREALKLLLEMPSVYETIVNFMQSELTSMKNNDKVYTSLFQGEIWKNISKHFVGKTVIPLYLYFDDFEINNPLSTSAGVHKVGGLYYSITGLPPKCSSAFDTVFLGQLIYNVDHKEFSNFNCFENIIEEVKFLGEQGITITINDKLEKVYFVVVAILGDNLGLNAIL